LPSRCRSRPGAAILGFSALPASFSAFLAAETATYLIIVEIAKRWLLRGTALCIRV